MHLKYASIPANCTASTLMIKHLILASVIFHALSAFTALQADDLFREKVVPLLERRCLSCHNETDRKGEFSLQTQQQLMASGFIEARQPDQSHLLSVVLAGPDTARPAMPKNADPLSADEIETLRKWISAGAEWPKDFRLTEPVVDNFDWWSLRPITRPVTPELTDAAASQWMRTPIDAFVLSKLREHGLQPSAETDRRMQTSALTITLGALISMCDYLPQFRTSPGFAAAYVMGLLLISMWLVLLALGDAVASRVHMSQSLRKNRLTRQALQDAIDELRQKQAEAVRVADERTMIMPRE